MAPSSGSALALAATLRALDDDALERLIRERQVKRQGIRDYFDLAEALLDRTSIQSALSRLDRPTLALLALAGELAGDTGAPTLDRLSSTLGSNAADTEERVERAFAAGLLGRESGRIVPWDAVVEQLRSWPSFGLPSGAELRRIPAPAALEPVSDADARFVDRGAAERAFSTVSTVFEIVQALRAEPARRVSRGGLALPDARRLAAAADIEVEELDVMLDLAERAGLVTAAPRAWSVTDEPASWLEATRLERWRVLAAAWLSRLPEELRELLHQRAHAVWGEGLLDYLDWRYPAGREWVRERISLALAGAEKLGIIGSNRPSTAGSTLLAEGPDAAAAVLAAHFPAEVEKVYLQHDLSIVAPGPLAPELDRRLRLVADIDARGLASSYRVTAATVTRALIAGETGETLLDFLAGISLTGVPQPLDYLVRDTASHFGTLRVGPAGEVAEAQSVIRSTDRARTHQLLVDPNLAPIALRELEDGRLTSRFAPEVVYWSLHDARYPVVAENAAGQIVTLQRARAVGDAGGVSDDTAAIVVARLRDSTGSVAESGDEGWIARQLELAAKNKVAVAVRVQMPDGTEQEFVLEPAAVAGGRVRARDRKSDLERTLPLSSITAVEPVGD
ncbi:helicase-associated domain-containing protein [uncultured Schumannella sp.]|uniref:helicase-associated domain-containing protein n=1 Tax=uncultured Schumannella sp. TaxID=1195956 RepID=UPI0025FA932A|nr:helicase-associated domain-containing protein [uncultured Schumannella sp.]